MKKKLSSFDYWQFWRNTDDRDVIRYLQLFTELSEKEIESYKNLSGDEINKAKIKLANEATKLLHGATAAIKAEATSHQTFVNKSTGGELPTKK